MLFKIELNGIKLERDIPTDWDQVTFKTFRQLTDRKELSVLSVFTGIDPETLKKAKITNIDKLIKALSFVKTNPSFFKLPKKILDFEIRPDLGFEPFGRYTDLKEIVETNVDKPDELLKQYPLMAAIYCQQGEYDFKQAEQSAELFYNAPCTEVLALGNFLLMRLGALRNSTAKTSLLARIVPKRWRLGFLLLRSRLAFTVRYYILKKRLHLTEMKYKL